MCSLGGLRSVGHKGKFGHEFMEFEFRPDGRLRYANNSNYKNDIMIRKEGACLCVSMRACVCAWTTLAGHRTSCARNG